MSTRTGGHECNCDAFGVGTKCGKVAGTSRMVDGQRWAVQRMSPWGAQVKISHRMALVSHHTSCITGLTWVLPLLAGSAR